MTFTCDVKIDLIRCESHGVKLISVNLLPSSAVWLFDISFLLDILKHFDTLWTFWHMTYYQRPHRAIFSHGKASDANFVRLRKPQLGGPEPHTDNGFDTLYTFASS